MNELTPVKPEHSGKAEAAAKAARARKAVKTDTEYAQFLPAAMEISMSPPPRVVPILIATIMGAILVALIWSSLARLDVFTNAAAECGPPRRRALYNHLKPGRITEIRRKMARM